MAMGEASGTGSTFVKCLGWFRQLHGARVSGPNSEDCDSTPSNMTLSSTMYWAARALGRYLQDGKSG